MNNLGKLIRTLRDKENLTQKDLAIKVGTDDSTVSKWERNKNLPDITLVPQIAQALNVTCDELLHPTETLQKINETVEDTFSTPDEDNAIVSNDAMEMQDVDTLSDVQTIVSAPKRNLSILKRALLICAPIIVIAVSVGVYCYIRANNEAKKDSETSPFQLVETRTNVESDNGPAYELVFLCTSDTSENLFRTHSKVISDAWDNGEYEDSTENVLIVSYYLSLNDINTKDAAYFRGTFLKD